VAADVPLILLELHLRAAREQLCAVLVDVTAHGDGLPLPTVGLAVLRERAEAVVAEVGEMLALVRAATAGDGGPSGG
jgi:hypothetical protein